MSIIETLTLEMSWLSQVLIVVLDAKSAIDRLFAAWRTSVT